MTRFFVLLILILAVKIESTIAGLSCLSCQNVRNVTECARTISCGQYDKCFTATSGHLGDRRFTFGCKSEQECNGLTAVSGLIGRRRKRASQDINCHQCCAQDRCNALLCSQFDKVTVTSGTICEDSPAINCSELSRYTPICADVDHAKTLCKKWCGFCPIGDGNWSDWSAWSSCSVTCDTGHMTRTRTCTNPAPAHGGHDCIGASSDSLNCHHSTKCPVNGGWGSWLSWEPCSVTCGSGMKKRQRNCDHPAPLNNGHGCYGDVHDYTSCSARSCHVNGGWGSWSPWGSCSVTCGTGLKRRERTCDNPAPVNNGRDCHGDRHDYASCSTNMCYLNGGWGSWSPWGSCSVTCGTGLKRRERTCDNPAPVNNGRDCRGDRHDYASCSTNMCYLSQPNVTFYIRDVQDRDVATGDKVLYKTTLVDTSGSYNSSTGVFTAPVAGLYVFTVTASVVNQHGMGLQIKTTSSQGQLGELYHYNHDAYSTSSLTGVGELQAGSQVWVQCLHSTGSGDDLLDNWSSGYQNSFQGALVRAL